MFLLNLGELFGSEIIYDLFIGERFYIGWIIFVLVILLMSKSMKAVGISTLILIVFFIFAGLGSQLLETFKAILNP